MKPAEQAKAPPLASLTVFIICYILGVGSLTIVFATSDAYARSLGLSDDDVYWFSGLSIGIPSISGAAAVFLWDASLNKLGFTYTIALMGCCGMLGQFGYALAGIAQSPTLLLMSRSLLGIGSSSNVVFRFLGITCDKKTKSSTSLLLMAAVNMGFAIGPLLGFIISTICRTVGADASSSAPLAQVFNENTLPGWIMGVGYCFYIVLVFCIFVDISQAEWAEFLKSRDLAVERASSCEVTTTSEPLTSKCRRLIPLCVLAFAISAISLGIGSLEARLGFVAERRWGWTPEVTGLYLAAVFAAMVPFTVGFALAHRRWQFEDRVVILCIFVSSMLSLALIFGYREQIVTSVVLWTLATLVFCGGLSSGRGFVFGLSLKLCSPRQLSGWSTWSAITYKVGRGIGGVLGSFCPIEDGDNVYGGILLSLWVCTVAFTALSYGKLVPPAPERQLGLV